MDRVQLPAEQALSFRVTHRTNVVIEPLAGTEVGFISDDMVVIVVRSGYVWEYEADTLADAQDELQEALRDPKGWRLDKQQYKKVNYDKLG